MKVSTAFVYVRVPLLQATIIIIIIIMEDVSFPRHTYTTVDNYLPVSRAPTVLSRAHVSAVITFDFQTNNTRSCFRVTSNEKDSYYKSHLHLYLVTYIYIYIIYTHLYKLIEFT